MHEPLVLAIVTSPWGPVRLAAGPRGVVAVALLATTEAFAAGLTRRGLGPLVALDDAPAGPARALADRASAAIAAIVRGEDVDAAAIPVDLQDRPAWDRRVLAVVRGIPRGSTLSYGEVARRVDRPGAARAVGGAVGRNPVGLIVPCHRVIAADGTLGGYGVAAVGGREAALDVKRALLALEGVSPG